MPDKKFLEEYPLYRKFNAHHLVLTKEFMADTIEKPAIHMMCEICKSEQTFTMINEYWQNWDNVGYIGSKVTQGQYSIRDKVLPAVYQCSACKTFNRYYYIKFFAEVGALKFMKVGQYPPFEINADKQVEKMLGEYFVYFKKGLICESQAYGVAAFAYYRRIIEQIIDTLLEDISALLSGEDLVKYKKALEETKKTPIAKDKIALVKSLLPPSLCPEDMNPLSILHDALSKGIHTESDEICLESAFEIREGLVFLVHQINVTKHSSKTFTVNMRKILDSKAKS